MHVMQNYLRPPAPVRRAAEYPPYVFIGPSSAITGPYDVVVMSAWAEQSD